MLLTRRSILVSNLQTSTAHFYKCAVEVWRFETRSIYPSSGSNATPRFFAEVENLMQCSQICMYSVSIFANCCLGRPFESCLSSISADSIASTARHYRCIPRTTSLDWWRGSVDRVDYRRRTSELQLRVK